ncbi:MAG TPA: SAM-dependent methyltransferase [Candidatus Atribacteria bacterium]|nr:SAM-dependent methyltransferase [Candidatus Atribacteria bacterium]
MKKIIKKIIPVKYHKYFIKIKSIFFDIYAMKSYSQGGEDIILRSIFGEKKTVGFYVDVGAHHPKRFSNTYHFYKKGWRGINIDAKPGCMELFRRIRPRDINLEFAISDKRQTLIYYCSNEPALNGFSKTLSIERNKKEEYKIIDELKIETLTLAKVLDAYLPSNITIDFLSVDVEGLDFQVLTSNDWSKYKPNVVLVEDLNFSFDNPDNSKIYKFLMNKNYHLVAKTMNTVFYINDSFNIGGSL